MKIAFAYPYNRRVLLKEVINLKSPDIALYGFNHLKSENKAFIADVNPILEKLINILFYPLNKLFLSQTDYDFKLARALLMVNKLNKADVIVSNIDSMSLAICLLKKMNIVKTPMVYAVGLFYIQGQLQKTINTNKKSFFLSFYKWLLSAADQIIYHAQIEKEKLQKLEIYNPANCTFVAMGSDSNFFNQPKFKKIKSAQNLVVAVGKDRARDYKTLFEAAKKLSKVSFKVICRKDNVKGLEIPQNVEVYFDISYWMVAELYKKATIIVISVREMHRSSGQMTLTDGLQAHRPIIISDVVGISHYNLRNGVDVLLVRPQNTNSLKRSIERLLNDKELQTKLINNSKSKPNRYSTKHYAEEILKVANLTIGETRLLPLDEKHLEFARYVRNQNRQFFISKNLITKTSQKKWFDRYLKKKNDYVFVLKKGIVPIGVGSIYNINFKQKIAEIGRFAIVEEFQKRGYGKILLKEIQKIAFVKLRLKGIYLEVLQNNNKAISLYRNEKFLPIVMKKNSGRPVLIMRRDQPSDI